MQVLCPMTWGAAAGDPLASSWTVHQIQDAWMGRMP